MSTNRVLANRPVDVCRRSMFAESTRQRSLRYGHRAFFMGLMFFAVAACSGDQAPTDLLVPDLLPRQSSVYSYGDLMPDEHGELYPVGSSRPAEINFYSTNFEYFTCEYLSGCSATLRALHRGVWNYTKQDLQIMRGSDVVISATATSFGCRQTRQELGMEVCIEKEADNSETMFFDVCGVSVRGKTFHSAWFVGFFSLPTVSLGPLSFTPSVGQQGTANRTSYTTSEIEQPSCSSGPSGGEGGGGGEGGTQECFDVYVIWYDPDTHIVQFTEYLYTYCNGGNVQ